ncbi:hypothetical protein FOCC_FOCC014601 [Frankliniella occidentalis]|nr:hypothetical protein FOCC_FOCC014601 [Frankliniella occidentalis]
MPREFARIPRSLEAFKRWKVTELGQLLRYTGPAVLNDCMPVEVYKLFLLLHVATRIVSHPVLVKDSSYLDYAEKLFSTFVQHCAHPTVFKPAFVVYNEHSLLHLVDDVRKFGNIFDFSAFPFENFLGILKRIVRSGVHITQQVARRLEEMDGFVAGPKCTPSHFIPHNFDETKAEFKYLVCKDFTLSPHYKKDAFFKTQDSIGRVFKIMKTSDGFKIRANVCSKLENFYSYPLPSHKVGIFKVSRWSSLDVEIDPACITANVMVIPSKAGWMAAELLHCVN